MKRTVHLLLALALVVPAAVARPASDLDAKLAAIETAMDAKRKELGIPGVALAIVKDDKVIYSKGLGLRNVEKQLPVTPDTLFAIGSSSKAFTAMGVAIAADAGKLSLDDSPKKHLPYFKLQDADADAKITVRDLLSHRSGLNRTDLGWASGVLTAEEIVRVAGNAKPTAKLGEKFQYQNVMFLAAGLISANTLGMTWDELMEKRIFDPLGMDRTVTTVGAMQKTDDHALGYVYNFATKETRQLPMRDLHEIGPAGGINSSAADMVQWIRLMLNEGVHDGKRLVSEKLFEEIVSPQMNVGKGVDYGLGWFIRDWNGKKVVEHGGNIDGFNALVALMPEEKLGFVMLTNVSGSSLGQFAMNTIWSNIVGDPNAAAAVAGEKVDPQKEAGVYSFAEAGFDVTVAYKDGKLTMSVPGQPVYPLESVSGRRYKLAAPAPDGFFATFRPKKDDPSAVEMYLEQPQGNYVLAKKGEAVASAPAGGSYDELVGSYKPKEADVTIEIAAKDGKTTLVVPGQPPYTLVEKEKDVYAAPPLPDSYAVHTVRDASGKVSGIVLKQPQGDFALERIAGFKADITADELMAKVVAAMGGEANIRKHTTRVSEIEVDLENQGVTGVGTIYAKAPTSIATEVTLTALGKKLGASHDYFDGTTGGEWTTFTPGETYAGKRLADIKIASDFHAPLNWKSHFESAEIKRKDTVDGEEVYVVTLTPKEGNAITDYISTKRFLLLRRDTVAWSDTMNMGIPVTTFLSDYREVDGLMMPFTITSKNPASGTVVVRVKKVEHGVPVKADVFKRKL